MNNCGGTADDLKSAIDELMDDGITDQYLRKQLSVCCDGASLYMGKHNGVDTQLKRLLPWLLVIHCVNHRLELAIKDGFKKRCCFIRGK